MNYYDTPDNPLSDVLRAMTGKEPPGYTRGHYYTSQLSDEDSERLQHWCSDNANPYWTTGIGLMDAVDAIIGEAVGNGNICGPGPGPSPGDGAEEAG